MHKWMLYTDLGKLLFNILLQIVFNINYSNINYHVMGSFICPSCRDICWVMTSHNVHLAIYTHNMYSQRSLDTQYTYIPNTCLINSTIVIEVYNTPVLCSVIFCFACIFMYTAGHSSKMSVRRYTL